MDPREWLFDRRVVSRNLSKGVLKQKDYKEYLKKITDAADKLTVLDLDGKNAENVDADTDAEVSSTDDNNNLEA